MIWAYSTEVLRGHHLATVLGKFSPMATVVVHHLHTAPTSLPLPDSRRSNMSPIRTHLLTALSLSSFKFLPGWAQSQECYWSNGMLANSDFKPCNQDRPAGSQSACCNLGKSPADVCLGGGLCENEETDNGNALIYAVGCTDPSGEDPNCQQYCIGEFCHCRVSTQTQQRWLFLKVTAILSHPNGTNTLWPAIV